MDIPTNLLSQAQRATDVATLERAIIIVSPNATTLLSDIAALAEHRANMAVLRGDDADADQWFRLQEAADDALMASEPPSIGGGAQTVAIGGARDRVGGGVQCVGVGIERRIVP